MGRFIAMHESESGFDSPAAVLDWIAATRKPNDEWRIVEILVDPVTEKYAGGEVAKAREQGYIDGIETERRLMRLRLGLAVSGDGAE